MLIDQLFLILTCQFWSIEKRVFLFLIRCSVSALESLLIRTAHCKIHSRGGEPRLIRIAHCKTHSRGDAHNMIFSYPGSNPKPLVKGEIVPPLHHNLCWCTEKRLKTATGQYLGKILFQFKTNIVFKLIWSKISIVS